MKVRLNCFTLMRRIRILYNYACGAQNGTFGHIVSNSKVGIQNKYGPKMRVHMQNTESEEL